MSKQPIKIFVILLVAISLFFIEKIYSFKSEYTDIEKIIKSRQSGQIVIFEGEVVKVLKDDLKGDKHQKFILKINEYTVLLVHNIDIAPRVPAIKGDILIVNGEYEWNNQGGLVHWTHRSTNSHPEGWVKHKNIKYN
jgi:hypothetical protein